MYIYVYMYVYMYVCVCVCVCRTQHDILIKSLERVARNNEGENWDWRIRESGMNVKTKEYMGTMYSRD